MEKQLTPGAKIKHKMQLMGRLECVMQFHNEGVIHLAQHAPFREGVFNLFLGHDIMLAENFDGVPHAGIPTRAFYGQHDLAK
jgi:hypothetical protein